jgi:hypothetical protein
VVSIASTVADEKGFKSRMARRLTIEEEGVLQKWYLKVMEDYKKMQEILELRSDRVVASSILLFYLLSVPNLLLFSKRIRT